MPWGAGRLGPGWGHALTPSRTRPAIAALLAVLALLPPAAGAARAAPTIHIVSNRADLISGGDALVTIDVPTGTSARDVRVRLGPRDVTRHFPVRRAGVLGGLVTGLRNGRSTLSVSTADGGRSSVTIINHPNGGPVFSGPQIEPWTCQPTAKDKQCNQPATFEYLYRSTDPTKSGLQAYDLKSPPDDVETTTTDQGVTVPFIVRIETGYQDRDQYKIAMLYQPGKSWTPWAPQKQWNHKLVVTHGANCNIDYGAGDAPSVTPAEGVAALERGFAVMSTALDHNGHNCNIATQAESLVMAKEHLIESYGTIRYTIATGCSGGSLTQQQVANAYPGIYQGLLPQCSFPDTWSSATQVADYHMLRLYFENPSRWGPGVVWTPTQWAAVEGHIAHVDAIVSDVGFFNAANPTQACGGVPENKRYHPQERPGGVRCSIGDYSVNLFGPRTKPEWGPQEKKIGRPFAGIPVDNTGVQYGLEALRQGVITPAQFVDLNVKIGGLDIDTRPWAKRIVGTAATFPRAYRSGAINETNNLDQVAIINLTGPDPGAAHDAYRAFAIRARLEREHGGFRNHVIWFGAVPVFGGLDYPTQGLIAMDRWLRAVEKDRRDIPLAAKIAADRPDDVHDHCSDVPGLEVVELPGLGRVCELPLVQTRFGTPRMVAGDAITTDANKCRLKPLRRSDYDRFPLRFTEAEWRGLAKLFTGGVCDYAKPAVGQRDTVPWQTYQDAKGKVVYGGRAMPPPPANSGEGWTSPSFASWRGARA